jgi:hypothetical protein
MTSLPGVIQWLRTKQAEYENQGFTDLELHYAADWDSPYEISIVGTREETDKEFDARMKAIEADERREAVKMQEHLKFIQTEAKRLGILS